MFVKLSDNSKLLNIYSIDFTVGKDISSKVEKSGIHNYCEEINNTLKADKKIPKKYQKYKNYKWKKIKWIHIIATLPNV